MNGHAVNPWFSPKTNSTLYSTEGFQALEWHDHTVILKRVFWWSSKEGSGSRVGVGGGKGDCWRQAGRWLCQSKRETIVTWIRWQQWEGPEVQIQGYLGCNVMGEREEWLWFLAWMTWGRARLMMETDRQEMPQAECVSSGVRPPD